MPSFLITFKPVSENRKLGWPIDELQKLVAKLKVAGKVTESWRFHNRKEVSIGDRVFLLLQGKRGPAIIGYGRTSGPHSQIGGKWEVPIEFEQLVDPEKFVLADADDLLALASADPKIWRSQASGVRLDDEVASDLAKISIGGTPKPAVQRDASNPDWTRDELIVALNVYLSHRPNPPNKDGPEIRELSSTLRRIGEAIFPGQGIGRTFRNENGVYMKLMNFRRLDPEYTASGKTGLSRGGQAEETVWAEFATDPARCKVVADAIIRGLNDPAGDGSRNSQDLDDDFEEAPEGRILTRIHRARERNRKLVLSKKGKVLKATGRLTCEACKFNFSTMYGERGDGFIECHHTKPVTTLEDGAKTHLDDLALLCANCHRMIHRRRPWLTLNELTALLQTRAT